MGLESKHQRTSLISPDISGYLLVSMIYFSSLCSGNSSVRPCGIQGGGRSKCKTEDRTHAVFSGRCYSCTSHTRCDHIRYFGTNNPKVVLCHMIKCASVVTVMHLSMLVPRGKGEGWDLTSFLRGAQLLMSNSQSSHRGQIQHTVNRKCRSIFLSRPNCPPPPPPNGVPWR